MSNLIPREFINELIARTDIVELIDARVPLKKAGRNHQACCPFHTEKSPSFTVSAQKQFYYCFGCGASGNALGFLMAYDRVEFIDAVEILAKQLGLEIPEDDNSKNKKKYSQDLYEPLNKTKLYYEKSLRSSPEAIQYLKNRGLSGETVKKYHIGFAPDRKKITFPIHDRRGRVIGFGWRVLDNSLPKYINSPDSPLFHKSQVLYGLYEAREANRDLEKILVVEGYMDVVSLAQADITFAVATLGTATTQQHVTQLLSQTDKIIFCFDGDTAGKKAAWRALESTLPVLQDNTEARFLFLPEGEDPDSLVKKIGKDDFLMLLESAQSLGDVFYGHIKSQVSSNTTEGRAQLVHLALPYIESISAPIFREMMLDRLAEMVRMEKNQLNKFVAKIARAENSGKLQRTPMRLAIALLLQNPILFNAIKEDLENLDLPGSEVLKEIFAELKQNSSVTTASLLECFRDKPNVELIHKLAAWEHGVPEEGITQEFQGIVTHLLKQQHQSKIEHLLKKANLNTLTEDEKRMLQGMLGEKT
ncbi:MAG TPA: DNA primase [Gammaproteobacteria bacterium]|nr:DNA primase [Gammaproteobacteria bacterium]